MSIRICVSYETPQERDAIDAALRALQPWKISDAPSKGKYARRYYRAAPSEKNFPNPLTARTLPCYTPITPAMHAGESEVPRQRSILSD